MGKCTAFDHYDDPCGAPVLKGTDRCKSCAQQDLRRVEGRILQVEDAYADLPRHRARRDALKKALGL